MAANAAGCSTSGAFAKCFIHVLSTDSDNSLGDTSYYSPSPILQMRTLKLSRLRTGGLLKRPWARKVSWALFGGVVGASGKVPRLWLALPWVGLAWPLGSSFRDALPIASSFLSLPVSFSSWFCQPIVLFSPPWPVQPGYVGRRFIFKSKGRGMGS